MKVWSALGTTGQMVAGSAAAVAVSVGVVVGVGYVIDRPATTSQPGAVAPAPAAQPGPAPVADGAAAPSLTPDAVAPVSGPDAAPAVPPDSAPNAPPEAAPDVADRDATATPDAVSGAQPSVAPIPDLSDPDPSASGIPASDIPAPAFDVVRIPQEGLSLVAGTAVPGSQVVVLLDADEAARATANAQVIRVLRLVGARDSYIARAFVRRFTLRALAGAAVGTFAGMLGIALLPSADAAGGFLTGLGFTGAGWLYPLALPPAAAIVAFVATRLAAFAKLRELT
jgi:hypothetical protein